MAEETGTDAKAAAAAATAASTGCSSAHVRASRSRCFKVYKYLLLLSIVSLFILSMASTPWAIDVTRDLLKDMNTTSVSMMYTGAQPIQVTDTLVYGLVGTSLLLTILYLLLGFLSIYKECFILTIIFGLSLMLCFAASICCYNYTLFLINLIIDFFLAPLVLLFAILIKRADRLAPESSQRLTNEEENMDSLKKKQRPVEDEDEVDNVKV